MTNNDAMMTSEVLTSEATTMSDVTTTTDDPVTMMEEIIPTSRHPLMTTIDLITTSADPVMANPDSPCCYPVFISSGIYDGKFGNSAVVAIGNADAICHIWLIMLELVLLMYSRLGSPHPCLLWLGKTCPDDNVDGVVIKFDFDPLIDNVKSISLSVGH
jgi:hypothetical protein